MTATISSLGSPDHLQILERESCSEIANKLFKIPGSLEHSIELSC